MVCQTGSTGCLRVPPIGTTSTTGQISLPSKSRRRGGTAKKVNKYLQKAKDEAILVEKEDEDDDGG